MSVSRRVIAAGLAILLSTGSAPLVGQQAAAPGSIGGKATDEAKKPYDDWAVQLRDVATGGVTGTKVLDKDGKFIFLDVPVSQRYLVELVKIKDKKIVCTEGPYALTPTAPDKLDVNIRCGKVPVAIWLIAAGAGAAAAIAVATRSTSK